MPSEPYWNLIDPVWELVSIYDGVAAFDREYSKLDHRQQVLLATHWAHAELQNGGFEQFFSNSTGLLAPQAEAGFRALGMPNTAAAIADAIALFGNRYPRDRNERDEVLDALIPDDEPEPEVFEDLEDRLFEFIDSENGGYVAAANQFAAS